MLLSSVHIGQNQHTRFLCILLINETNKKVSQIAYGLDTYNGTDEIVDCFASIQLTNDFAKPRLAEWAENPWFAKMIDERKSTCTYPESLQ